MSTTHSPRKDQEQLKHPRGKAPSSSKSTAGGAEGKGSTQRGEKGGGREGEGGAESGRKKPLTKEERRALQEAQRKAKADRLAGKVPGKLPGSVGGKPPAKPGGDATRKGDPRIAGQKSSSQGATPSMVPGMPDDPPKTHAKMTKSKSQEQTDQKQVQLFSHLHQYEREATLTRSLDFSSSSIPPYIVRLGLQYSKGIICGSNSRCIALLATFKKVIQNYTTPPEKELRRDLDAAIRPYISFLTKCRPLSASMGNAIKHLKLCISSISPDMPENEAKESLCVSIDHYLKARIIVADKAISTACGEVIRSGDVILVYAHSSIVLKALVDAHNAGIEFRVIVVDSRPKMEGRHYLRQLVRSGIKCSYVLINAVSYIMKEVSKVIVGAHSLLANGYVMSRIGTSLIALVAKSYNVPVLVCCETHKFCDKVQTDAFVVNELGDPNDLVPIGRRQGDFLSDWKDISSLGLLNLVYDVTSPDLIAMVITEVGNIPCTSVPVVLRIINREM